MINILYTVVIICVGFALYQIMVLDNCPYYTKHQRGTITKTDTTTHRYNSYQNDVYYKHTHSHHYFKYDDKQLDHHNKIVFYNVSFHENIQYDNVIIQKDIPHHIMIFDKFTHDYILLDKEYYPILFVKTNLFFEGKSENYYSPSKATVFSIGAILDYADPYKDYIKIINSIKNQKT